MAVRHKFKHALGRGGEVHKLGIREISASPHPSSLARHWGPYWAFQRALSFGPTPLGARMGPLQGLILWPYVSKGPIGTAARP